eukprot:TRINITY_DN5193_c0_g1_i2.p4 TRINITY_DN5193_c0_g1~~TRINITY_DN5193_c0_g1_i2.p4  ORF type:complete len:169 (+),score=6.97 TRINITY_DN5193_c0_g1_i2:23-529(+)
MQRVNLLGMGYAWRFYIGGVSYLYMIFNKYDQQKESIKYHKNKIYVSQILFKKRNGNNPLKWIFYCDLWQLSFATQRGNLMLGMGFAKHFYIDNRSYLNQEHINLNMFLQGNIYIYMFKQMIKSQKTYNLTSSFRTIRKQFLLQIENGYFYTDLWQLSSPIQRDSEEI